MNLPPIPPISKDDYFFSPLSLLFLLFVDLSTDMVLEKKQKKFDVIKIIVGIIVLTIILFMGYLFKYQQIVDEGSVLADEQCLNVEPLIKEKKALYDSSLQILDASGSAEEYMTETSRYLGVSTKFIKAQREWLNKQRIFINRWDYKLLVPSYIQELSRLQFISREADVRSQEALEEAFTTSDNKRQLELSNTVIIEADNRNKADEDYNRIWKNYSNKFDIRTYFVNIPTSACLNIN